MVGELSPHGRNLKHIYDRNEFRELRISSGVYLVVMR